MDCSTPGFLVHHLLPELAQTHVHSLCPLTNFYWVLSLSWQSSGILATQSWASLSGLNLGVTLINCDLEHVIQVLALLVPHLWSRDVMVPVVTWLGFSEGCRGLCAQCPNNSTRCSASSAPILATVSFQVLRPGLVGCDNFYRLYFILEHPSRVSAQPGDTGMISSAPLSGNPESDIDSNKPLKGSLGSITHVLLNWKIIILKE